MGVEWAQVLYVRVLDAFAAKVCGHGVADVVQRAAVEHVVMAGLGMRDDLAVCMLCILWKLIDTKERNVTLECKSIYRFHVHTS